MALTHAGAQVVTHTVLLRDVWALRISAHGPDERPKTSPALRQDVAGPLCFAGDVVAHDRELPELAEGDWVVLHDAGAYCFTAAWSYNSLPRPAVHGYRAASDGGGIAFATVRTAQTLDEIVRESGLDRADALLRGFGDTPA